MSVMNRVAELEFSIQAMDRSIKALKMELLKRNETSAESKEEGKLPEQKLCTILIQESCQVTKARELLSKLESFQVQVPSPTVQERYRTIIQQATEMVTTFIHKYEQGKEPCPFILELVGECFAENWFSSHVQFEKPSFDARTSWKHLSTKEQVLGLRIFLC
jgi:hypothetical protein